MRRGDECFDTVPELLRSIPSEEVRQVEVKVVELSHRVGAGIGQVSRAEVIVRVRDHVKADGTLTCCWGPSLDNLIAPPDGIAPQWVVLETRAVHYPIMKDD